jgi:hypothetical protein
MRVDPIQPPREFDVGRHGGRLRHTADVALDPDEQVTFVRRSGAEYDVVAKDWGYYATPSLNGRLHDHGLRAVLAVNSADRVYVLLVERGAEPAFEEYMALEQMRVVCWLDDDAAVAEAVARLER